MKHAEFVYYTGTGNTLRALAIVAGELERNGWTVSMTDMGMSTVPDLQSPAPGAGDLLIVGFPTLGFSAPASVFPCLARLPHAMPPDSPQAEAPRAVVLCACGASATKNGRILKGWSGTASHKVAAALARLGYRTVASADISYTENWTQVVNPAGGKLRETITLRGDAEAAAFGADLAAGRFCTIRRGLPARVFGPAAGWLFRTVARRTLSRMFAANPSCTGCGLCTAVCPAGAIAMRSGRPVWNLDCTACNRCINVCPARAIQTTYARLVLMGGLNIALAFAAWPWARAIRQIATPALTGTAVFPLTLALFCAVFCFGTLFQLGPLEWLIRKLEGFAPVSRIFNAAFTTSYNRYLAPGFKPGKSPYRKPCDR